MSETGVLAPTRHKHPVLVPAVAFSSAWSSNNLNHITVNWPMSGAVAIETILDPYEQGFTAVYAGVNSSRAGGLFMIRLNTSTSPVLAPPGSGIAFFLFLIRYSQIFSWHFRPSLRRGVSAQKLLLQLWSKRISFTRLRTIESSGRRKFGWMSRTPTDKTAICTYFRIAQKHNSVHNPIDDFQKDDDGLWSQGFVRTIDS